MSDSITQAVILAAGRGSRLAASHSHPEEFSKPLLEVGGRTLLGHSLYGCMEAGVEKVVVVTGYQSELVARESESFDRIEVSTVYNDRWEEPNGVSVLAARAAVSGDFLLLMADHLFDSSILRDLATGRFDSDVVVAVDPNVSAIVDIEDATKVVRESSRIVRIGKDLVVFDAVDCGLFRCSHTLFDAIETASRGSPPSLTVGLRQLIRSGGSFTAMEIGERWWQDVDTPEMASVASRILSRESGD